MRVQFNIAQVAIAQSAFMTRRAASGWLLVGGARCDSCYFVWCRRVMGLRAKRTHFWSFGQTCFEAVHECST